MQGHAAVLADQGTDSYQTPFSSTTLEKRILTLRDGGWEAPSKSLPSTGLRAETGRGQGQG